MPKTDGGNRVDEAFDLIKGMTILQLRDRGEETDSGSIRHWFAPLRRKRGFPP